MANSNSAIMDHDEITKAVTAATLRFQARLLKLDDVALYLGCVKSYAKRLAETAGAVRRLGASWLCDRVILDDYLNQQTGDLADPETVRTWRGGKA